eukprot:752484-Hanusia_phi.AAC.1
MQIENIQFGEWILPPPQMLSYPFPLLLPLPPQSSSSLSLSLVLPSSPSCFLLVFLLPPQPSSSDIPGSGRAGASLRQLSPHLFLLRESRSRSNGDIAASSPTTYPPLQLFYVSGLLSYSFMQVSPPSSSSSSSSSSSLLPSSYLTQGKALVLSRKHPWVYTEASSCPQQVGDARREGI